MKKIIALALVLVMAFAVAATAMAAVGDTVADLPSTPNIDIKVERLKRDEDASGSEVWVNMGATEGIKPGKQYGVKITLTVPKNYTNDEETWLTVKVDGAEEDTLSPKMIYGGHAPAAIYQTGPDKTKYTTWGNTDADGENIGNAVGSMSTIRLTTVNNKFPARNEEGVDLKYVYLISFWAVQDEADADDVSDAKKITVRTILADTTLYEKLADIGSIWIEIGGKNYSVQKRSLEGEIIRPTSVEPAFSYWILNDEFDEGIILYCGEPRADGYAEVGEVHALSTAVNYEFHRAYATTVSGELAFENFDGTVDVTKGDDGFDELKGVLDKYLGLMGWSFSGNLGWVKDEDFEKLAGHTGEKIVTATFAPYTLTLTVSNPAAVPDTGDSSVLGIVMAAIAILTCAAVVIRKERI